MSEQTKSTLAFHGNDELRNHMLLEVVDHIAKDAVIKGSYSVESENVMGFSGCFIGCTVHSFNPNADETTCGSLAEVEKAYNFPPSLTRICESIFEALDEDELGDFFYDVVNSASAGMDTGVNVREVPQKLVAATMMRAFNKFEPGHPGLLSRLVDLFLRQPEAAATAEEIGEILKSWYLLADAGKQATYVEAKKRDALCNFANAAADACRSLGLSPGSNRLANRLRDVCEQAVYLVWRTALAETEKTDPLRGVVAREPEHAELKQQWSDLTDLLRGKTPPDLALALSRVEETKAGDL